MEEERRRVAKGETLLRIQTRAPPDSDCYTTDYIAACTAVIIAYYTHLACPFSYHKQVEIITYF